MRGSRNFCKGGGVQAQQRDNSLENFFYVCPWVFKSSNLFYSLQRWTNGYIAEKTMLFQGIRGGPTFMGRGVQLFTGGGGGVQMLISLEFDITSDSLLYGS